MDPMDMKAWGEKSFRAALWAGMAAPTSLYAQPMPYAYYLGTYSVPQSFAQVGSLMSYTMREWMPDGRRRVATR